MNTLDYSDWIALGAQFPELGDPPPFDLSEATEPLIYGGAIATYLPDDFSAIEPPIAHPPYGIVAGVGDISDSIMSVTDEDLIEFNGNVRQLDADIARTPAPPFDNPDGTPNDLAIDLFNFRAFRWTQFLVDWETWRLARTTLDRISKQAAVEFGDFRARFNVLLEEAQLLGVVTSAEPSSTKPPPEPADDKPGIVERVARALGEHAILYTAVGVGALFLLREAKK